MIKKYLIILILIAHSVFVYAETEELRTSKDLIPESLKKFNNIEYISDELKFADFNYTHNSCQRQELGEKKHLEGSKKYIKFVSTISHGQAELKVNGVHIIAVPKQSTEFVLAENCTKLIPVRFISGSDQEYLGVNLKRGNVFRYFVNNMGHLMWGKIDEDGYLKPSNTKGLNFFKTIQQNTFENNFYQNLLQCAEVRESVDSKKGFYFLNGKKYDFKMARPKFWRANSKYLGHRLCSNQPHAIIDCEGTPEWRTFSDFSIFGVNKDYLEDLDSDEERALMKKEVAGELKQAKELGKKCDAIIAKYEKDTGKKVKVSPFYIRGK